MKKLIFILSIVASFLYGCHPAEEKANKHIQYFFETMAEFKCADSTLKEVQLSFRYLSLNQEKTAFEFHIPDSIKYADFYNAYSSRIVDAYFKSRQVDSTRLIDSLFISQGCNCDDVKDMIIKHYCADRVFAGIFKTAFSCYYMNKDETREYEDIIDQNKTRIEIDSLMQISLAYFDIAGYDPDRGFAFHFGCGSNPYTYNLENRVNFLISGFCQEALTNPEMLKAYSQITKNLSEKIKVVEGEIRNPDEICKKYEKELYRMLLEEGTLKKSLLKYYETRKDIEPFEIIY